MRTYVLTTCLFLLCFAAIAQRLSSPEMIKLTKTHSMHVADSTIKAIGFAYPPTHKVGILPVIYVANPDANTYMFSNRYEVTKWKQTNDSTFAINFVPTDTLQFNKLIDEFVAEKFVRTSYVNESINKDYTSEKYPGIVMRIQYNQLLNMGPNKIGVYYSWR